MRCQSCQKRDGNCCAHLERSGSEPHSPAAAVKVRPEAFCPVRQRGEPRHSYLYTHTLIHSLLFGLLLLLVFGVRLRLRGERRAARQLQASTSGGGGAAADRCSSPTHLRERL